MKPTSKANPKRKSEVPFAPYLRKELKKPAFKAAFEAEGVKLEAALAILELRKQKKLSQQQLAEKIGAKQSAVARFERGDTNPTLETISRMASAMGKKVKITLI